MSAKDDTIWGENAEAVEQIIQQEDDFDANDKFLCVSHSAEQLDATKGDCH